MISAVVLVPDPVAGATAARSREVVVRSLSWLVSAVVAGVVRDVTLAAPAGLGLGEIAEQAGCGLVQAETEAERLAEAIRVVRGAFVLVIRSGWEPQHGLIDDIGDLVRHEPRSRASILATPDSFVQRLFPDRAETIGLLAPVASCREAGAVGFRRLARSLGGGVRLRHRASPIA